MKSTLSFVLLVVIFSPLFNFRVYAQKPVFLAPQPHKLLYADTVYREAIAKHDSSLLAEAYYLYGKTYIATGDRVTGLSYFLKSLRILEQFGDSPKLSRLYAKMGENELLLGNYKNAVEFSLKAMKIAQRTGSAQYLAHAYNNFGRIYERDWSENGKKKSLPKMDLQRALYYFKLVERQAISRGDSLAFATSNIYIGRFLFNNYGNEAAFIRRLNLAYNIYTKKGKQGERIEVLLAMAHHYLRMGHFKTMWLVLEQAREIFERSRINSVGFKNQFDNLYSSYYQKTGDWKKAYEYADSLRKYEAAQYLVDRDVALSRLGKEYETEKKDAQLKAKDTQIKLRSEALQAQQKFSFTLAGFLALATVMAGLFYKLNKKNYRISQQNELLVKEQNHRVKNNLQAISSLLSLQSAALSDPLAHRAIEESRLRVETIALIHRRLYEGDDLAIVHVPEFLEELAESVLTTYGIKNVVLNFMSDTFYLTADKSMYMGLILNELITNACKYAFPGHAEPVLSILCRQSKLGTDRTRIEMIVADNGHNPESQNMFDAGTGKSFGKTNGFGMKLIEMQTQQLYANYSFRFQNGTVFQMNFIND